MTEKDPICSMNVDPKKAETKSLVISKKGKNYYFCSKGCKDKFSSNKHRSLGSSCCPNSIIRLYGKEKKRIRKFYSTFLSSWF